MGLSISNGEPVSSRKAKCLTFKFQSFAVHVRQNSFLFLFPSFIPHWTIISGLGVTYLLKALDSNRFYSPNMFSNFSLPSPHFEIAINTIIDATYQFGVSASRCLFGMSLHLLEMKQLSVIVAFPCGKLLRGKQIVLLVSRCILN